MFAYIINDQKALPQRSFLGHSKALFSISNMTFILIFFNKLEHFMLCHKITQLIHTKVSIIQHVWYVFTSIETVLYIASPHP